MSDSLFKTKVLSNAVTLDELLQASKAEIERNRARLSLSQLADIFQLKKTTIRRLDIKPAYCGLSRREARYEQADIIAYLVGLNPDHSEVWPHKLGRFIKPEEVGWMLSTAGKRITPATLAKWRYKGFGPIFIRVSRRTIRYRAEDVNLWMGLTKQSLSKTWTGL
jgi:hypothetical protein